MKTLSNLFSGLLLLFLSYTNGYSQNWDFEKYPQMDVQINHLDAELKISENLAIEGDILYTLNFKVSEADSMVLDAVGMEIARVMVNENRVDYTIEKDRIIIFFNETYSKNDEVNLRIEYRAEPLFSVHENLYGTSWTSLLPRSVRHWLPVYDHPRTRFTTDLVFTHPAGNNIVANGRKGDTEVLSVDQEMTTFSSNKRISASTLSWALGELEPIATTMDREQSVIGDIDEGESQFQRNSDSHIHIYSDTTPTDGSSLLNTAISAFMDVQNEMGVKYPFRDLHIIILNDLYWETKNYGSGIFYVYKDRGSLEDQIRLGILSQWIGAFITEEQWGDSEALLSLKALKVDQLFEIEENDYHTLEPYHVFTDAELFKWQEFISHSDQRLFREQISEVFGDVITNQPKVLGWNELAELVYDHTGKPYFEKPEPEYQNQDNTEEIEYRVIMDWDEDENTLELNFMALGEGAPELVNVESREVTISGEETETYTITGESETIILNVDSGIENLKVSVTDRDDIVLIEEKPFMFWVHQLRNDEDTDSRIQAAKALANFPDNPDLQLALTDLVRVENNPEVHAEILRSLSKITMGASGTDQFFLEKTSADQPEEIRLAAVEALAFYNESDLVVRQLRNVITNSETSSEIRRSAIRSLFEITDAESFKNIAETDVTNEAVLREVPLYLELLAEKGETESTIRLSQTFLDRGFPYSVREKAFNLLIEYDNDESNWEPRLESLLADRDPRIRYKAAEGLYKLSTEARAQFIDLQLVQEYDERIRRKLQEMD